MSEAPVPNICIELEASHRYSVNNLIHNHSMTTFFQSLNSYHEFLQNERLSLLHDFGPEPAYEEKVGEGKVDGGPD